VETNLIYLRSSWSGAVYKKGACVDAESLQREIDALDEDARLYIWKAVRQAQGAERIVCRIVARTREREEERRRECDSPVKHGEEAAAQRRLRASTLALDDQIIRQHPCRRLANEQTTRA